MHKSKDRLVPYKGYLGKLSQFNIPHQEGTKGIFVPEGLYPLIDELFGEDFPYAPKSHAETTPLHDYSGSNPILGKLSRQKRLLVNIPDFRMVDTLTEILKELPKKQVKIIGTSIEFTKRLKSKLAEKGLDSFYIDEPIPRENIQQNILIAGQARVASKAFKIEEAEIVIFVDSSLLCEDHSDPNNPHTRHKIDLARLFDPTFPTFFPEHANVLGFLSYDPPLHLKRKLWSLFSIDTLQINNTGSVVPLIQYRVAEFMHTKPPEFSSKNPSGFEIFTKAICQNHHRNKFVRNIVSKQINLANAKGLIKSNPHECSIVVIAKNEAHKNHILKHNLKSISMIGNVSSDSGDVSKIETESSLRSNLPHYKSCIFIRADASVGSIPDFNPSYPCFVIDIADKGLPGFDRNYTSRISAYQELGWVRENQGIFKSRWFNR